MKVAWISHSSDLAGGAERAMLAAVEGLLARGVEVAVAFAGAGELSDAVKRSGAEVHLVPYALWATINENVLSHRVKRTVRNLLYTPALARFLRRFGADVAVTNTLTVSAGALASRLVGVPHIWFMHEMYGSDGHGWHFDIGDRPGMCFVRSTASLVLTNSQIALESYAKHLPRGLLRRVHYPIDVPEIEIARAPNSAFHLLQLGRISAGKRAEDAVRAVQMLARKGLDVELTLAGNEEPSYGVFIRRLIQELEVQSRVHVLPFARNPFAQIPADVVLTCSQGEALGIATVEAMKFGKAVIGADSGGTRELIDDGTTGMLFRVGSAEDLAAAIERLYHDRDLLHRLGANARAWATATFTRERYISELLDAFSEVRKSA